MAVQRIGLEAVLLDDGFNAGVKNYEAGSDRMKNANKSVLESSKGLSTGLSAADDAMEESGKSAVELASQMEIVEQAYDAISTAIGEAVELAELGAQMQRTEKRFRAFAEGVDDADVLLAAFQRGAGGTVDEMTAMSSAARLLQMGLVGSADEMETVVEIATRLGDQTQSAGDRVSDFALLLANQSIPRLDNFGISSGKVRDRIKELQDAFPAMSREAAFSQAVFEQGAISLDKLGARTDDAGAKIERARANMQNMRVEMGQKLLPIVARVFGVIASLSSETLALITVLGGGIATLTKFSGGLGGLATKLGATGPQMAALGVAITGLVVAVEFALDKLAKMEQAQETAAQTAADFGTQLDDLVAGGMSVADAMAVLAPKVNEAAGSWDELNAVQQAVAGAMGAGKEFTDTMTAATDSLNAAVVRNVETFPQYVAEITAYNASVSEADAKATLLTENQFNMAKATERMTAQYAELTAQLEAQRAATDDLETSQRFSASALATMESETAVYDDKLTNLIRTQEEGKLVTDAEEAARKNLVHAIQESGEATARSTELAAEAQARQEASALAAAEALEAKRQKDIETAQAEADLATKVMDASDAMIAQTFISGLDPEAMGLTAYREAVENIQLAFGLATPESIALSRGITQGIDAANEGQIAYDELDEFIAALREDAADGSVDFDTLARSFASNSAEAQYLADRIEQTGDAMTDNVAQAEELIRAEDGLETSTKQLKDQMMATDDVLANVATGTDLWADSVTGTTHPLDDAKMTTDEWASSMQGLDERLARTGEQELNVTEKTEALTNLLERNAAATTETATSMDTAAASAGDMAAELENVEIAGVNAGGVIEGGFREGIDGAMPAMDEFSEKAASMDAELQNVEDNAAAHGAAIGSNLQSGLQPKMDEIVGDFRDAIGSLMDVLPGSEPKDPTSPLRNLGDAGAAIIDNITAGMNMASAGAVETVSAIGASLGDALATNFAEGVEESDQLADIFGAGGVLAGLGGAAAGILRREMIDPLEEQVGGMDDMLDMLNDRFGEMTERIQEIQGAFDPQRFESIRRRLEAGEEIPAWLLASEEELAMVKEYIQLQRERSSLDQRITGLSEERAEAARQLAEQEERILKLQEAQERLRFLEQQMRLLDLIAEKGLDAEAILGGLTLGVDASVEDVVDAMTAAMEAIIAQANEELGIGSPSRVFMRIGEETMTGLAMGIERLMSLPVAQSAIATQAMVSVPAMVGGVSGGASYDYSRSMGDVNIYNPNLQNQAQADQFEARVMNIVSKAMRGVR